MQRLEWSRALQNANIATRQIDRRLPYSKLPPCMYLICLGTHQCLVALATPHLAAHPHLKRCCQLRAARCSRVSVTTLLEELRMSDSQDSGMLTSNKSASTTSCRVAWKASTSCRQDQAYTVKVAHELLLLSNKQYEVHIEVRQQSKTWFNGISYIPDVVNQRWNPPCHSSTPFSCMMAWNKLEDTGEL